MTWRPRLVMGLGVSVMLLAVSGCAGMGSRARVKAAAPIETDSFYKYWAAQVPVRPGDAVRHTYLVDDNLYVLSKGGDVFAVHADHGLLRWGTNLAPDDYTVYPPSHLYTDAGDGPVLFVTTTKVVVLDRYNGDELFSAELPFPPAGGGVGDMQRLILGSGDGYLYSLIWNHPNRSDLVESWRLMAGSPVTTSVESLGEDWLYFATQRGAVVCCGARDKAFGWVRQLGDAVMANPFLDVSGVYVPCLDRSLYRIDPTYGDVYWRYRFPGPLRESPVVIGSTCYQYCPDDGLRAVDVDSGVLKWHRPDGLGVAAGGGTEIALTTTAGTVEVVSSATGETLRSVAVGKERMTAVNVRDETLYLTDPAGGIECLRSKGAPYLTRQEMAASRASLLNRPPTDTAAQTAAPARALETEQTDPLRSPRDR